MQLLLRQYQPVRPLRSCSCQNYLLALRYLHIVRHPSLSLVKVPSAIPRTHSLLSYNRSVRSFNLFKICPSVCLSTQRRPKIDVHKVYIRALRRSNRISNQHIVNMYRCTVLQPSGDRPRLRFTPLCSTLFCPTEVQMHVCMCVSTVHYTVGRRSSTVQIEVCIPTVLCS